MTDLLAGLVLAGVLGLGLWLWRRSFRSRPPARFPRIERVNVKRRVRKAMLEELRAQEPHRTWTAKQMERALRRQLRAERAGRQNGDAA